MLAVMTNKNAQPRNTENIGNTRHRKMTNKNTQPRDTDNIENTRHRKMTNKNTQPRDTDNIIVIFLCLVFPMLSVSLGCAFLFVIFLCLVFPMLSGSLGYVSFEIQDTGR
jgi:nitrate reductase NapE component